MNDDDAKKFILARRAKFIAAAVASVGMACGDGSKPPPCLSPMPAGDAADVPPPPTETPQVCLSVAPDFDAALPEPPPQPCLDVSIAPDAGPPPVPRTDAGVPHPPPQPCLSPKLPDRK